jgi:carbohydrate diacid regulator
MEIRKRHATAIIDNLQSVIQEDINIISPQGEIIASTDPLRVGSFHEGALHVA